MGDNRNFLIAILLSVIVFIGWQHFFVTPRMEAEKARQQAIAEQAKAANPAASTAPGADTARLPDVQGGPSGATVAPSAVDRAAALAMSPRIEIASDKLDGSIALRGARFDDLHLREYRETVDKTSPEITLFSPTHTDKPYFSEFGFIGAPGASVKLPATDSALDARKGQQAHADDAGDARLRQWRGPRLPPHDLTRREFPLHRRRQRSRTRARPSRRSTPTVSSRAPASPTPRPSTSCMKASSASSRRTARRRSNTPPPIKDAVNKSISDSEGWLGITDKYWAAALVPQAGHKFVARFSAQPSPTPGPEA